MPTFKEINQLRKVYELKQVYRHASVDDRKESTAEHTFSSLVLADFLMLKHDFNVNRHRVLDLILYHDFVEIYSGDMPLHSALRSSMQSKESAAAKRLFNELPPSLARKYKPLYEEFEGRQTREAKFAFAIEQLDAEIHELDYKKDWKGWTEELLRKLKGHCFEEFPELKKLFEEQIRYLRKNRYFDQS